jgi:hypothetical protein
MIKLTMVAPRQQLSQIAPKDEHGQAKVDWNSLTEQDMVAKPAFFHRDDIRVITYPNDAYPMVGAAVLSAAMGIIFVVESPEQVHNAIIKYS